MELEVIEIYAEPGGNNGRWKGEVVAKSMHGTEVGDERLKMK